MAFIAPDPWKCINTGVAGEDEDAPWAAKTSVHALLNSALPAHRPATAEEEEEDPMALLLEQKNSKKVLLHPESQQATIRSSGMDANVFSGLEHLRYALQLNNHDPASLVHAKVLWSAL